jgi:hypothetical protein
VTEEDVKKEMKEEEVEVMEMLKVVESVVVVEKNNFQR